MKYGIYDSINACQKEINGIFIDHGDLSASLGFADNPYNPVIINTINHVIRTGKNSGKLVAHAYSITDYKSYITENIDILFCSSDIT